MFVLFSAVPVVFYVLLVYFDYFKSTAEPAPCKNQKARKWMFRVLTSSLLTFQIGKRALDSWWGQLIFVASQLFLVEVTAFSNESLAAFSRCLIPSQVGMLWAQGAAAIPATFAIRTISALFDVTQTRMEHWVQLLVLVPSVLMQLDSFDEASLTKVALFFTCSVLVPMAFTDVADTLLKLNEKVIHALLPRFELEFQTAPARWSIFGSFVSFTSVILAQLLELNSGTYYDLLWQVVSFVLFCASVLAWGLTFCDKEPVSFTSTTFPAAHESPSLSQHMGENGTKNSNPTSPAGASWNGEEKPSSQPENVFLQRARHEDLMTFQAAMSFIHMLLVLFMTSIDLPHLAFVNLAVIAGLLFQEHTSASLHELVSGVVVAQALSLLALRHQLNEALIMARDANPKGQLGGVDAIVEQVGLVYCSIRLVAGAILAENFSRHSAETLLLASVSVFCSSGYSTRYLCLVMSWMAMFAARIRASAWAVASAWLNSEAELRRFMDHELKVSFAGIMLALEHCLTDDGLGRLPEETVDMLKEALAECKRGKELCFEAAVQRLAYDNAYELRVEGKKLSEGLQTSYHLVEQIMTPADRERVVYTDWNLVNHILDNAVANGAKYGTNLTMHSSIIPTGQKDVHGLRPAMLRVRVTNVPLKTERYAALLQMPDNNILFEDTVISRVRNHMWSLGSGRNSTHLGLPVAKLFATRLGGTVSLIAKPDLTTFALDVPVQVGPRSASAAAAGRASRSDSLSQQSSGPQESSTSDVDTSYPPNSNKETLPPGLVFAVLDDSSMIRSTMALTLKRDFLASDKSIVTGATPEEASTFAARAKAINADICIVDENLDYDVAGASMVGTKIVEELRSIGYTGVIVLYSANEKLELSLNWGLVDGFASKSANRVDTKRLLTKIYFESLQKKHGEALKRKPGISMAAAAAAPAMMGPPSSTAATASSSSALSAGNMSSAEEYSVPETSESSDKIQLNVSATAPVASGFSPAKVFVSNDVAIKSRLLPPSKDLSTFSAGYSIAIIPAHVQSALAIRAVDPNVSIIGMLPDSSAMQHDGVLYSAFVRFCAGLPAMDFNIDVETLQLFANGFDAVAKPRDVDAIDPAILTDLVEKRVLSQRRFFGGQTLRQEMDLSVLDDFETAEERNTMIEVFEQNVVDSLQRIYKRPTLDNVRKVAHLIKGASVQIGARALHRLSAKMEKYCESDFDGPQKDVHQVFADFFLLMVDFLLVAKTYFK